MHLIEEFRLEDKEKDKEKWYLVLELVAGGSLDEIAGKQQKTHALRAYRPYPSLYTPTLPLSLHTDAQPEKRLPEPLACRFARQLFKGLEFCHSKGVVHRDVKPSNLMVTSEGILKICDFGVAGTQFFSLSLNVAPPLLPNVHNLIQTLGWQRS